MNRRRWFSLAIAVALSLLVLLVRHLSWQSPLDVLQCTSEGAVTTCAGSLNVPQGGPLIMGYASDHKAELWLGKEQILTGRGQLQIRKVVPQGYIDLKVIYEQRLTLLWKPPGRRGPLEYLPASAVSRQPAETAPASSSPGANLSDGFAALSLLAIWLSWLLFLAWPNLRETPKDVVIGFLAVVLVALLVRVYGLGDAGTTWDEDTNWSAGKNYVTNVVGLDASDWAWQWNFEHPPITKYVLGIAAQFTNSFGPARLLSALLVSLACGLTFLILRRWFDHRTGYLAGGIAALTPHLIAHSQIAGHEATSVFLWALTIWWASSRPNDLWQKSLIKATAICGVLCGFAVFARFINVLLVPVVGLLLLDKVDRKQDKIVACVVIAGTLAAACLITGVLTWPRLWSSPLLHLQQSWQKLKNPHSPEPYLGLITNRPGYSYFVVYLFATTPAVVLALAFAGLVRAVVTIRNNWKTLLWFAAPLIVTLSPVRQDGVRYVLPSVLAIAALAGVGTALVMTQLGKWVAARWATWSVSSLLAAYLLFVVVRIQPYYLDYYNELVGGPQKVAAQKRFEIAWWGEGLDKAVDYINQHAGPDARIHRHCVEPAHLTWLRSDLWLREPDATKDADFVIHYAPSKSKCPVPKTFTKVFEVFADGAPLVRVFQRPLTPATKATPL